MRTEIDEIDWRKRIALFLFISFMIWASLFAFFYGVFVIAEYLVYDSWTAKQVLDVKFAFSMIFSILFALTAWMSGVYEMIEKYLARKNILRALRLEQERRS
jgi:glucan phosphoethanolaminetransferase (alkaline phosphatase superfamily)